MLWLAARADVRRQEVVLAACACARLALPHVLAGEMRPLRAIETAEAWAQGEAGVTLTDVRRAAAAAAAAYAAAAAAAAYAADAAAYAAYAADAYAAAYAADARARVLRECAALVRERIPWATVEAALWPSKETPLIATDTEAAKRADLYRRVQAEIGKERFSRLVCESDDPERDAANSGNKEDHRG